MTIEKETAEAFLTIIDDLRHWKRKAEIWERIYELKDCDCLEKDELWMELQEDE